MKNLVFIRVSNHPKMSDSLNAILVLSYFPCSDFPGLSVCDKGDFGEMHTTKIVFVADTSTFFANVTGLIGHSNNNNTSANSGLSNFGFKHNAMLTHLS